MPATSPAAAPAACLALWQAPVAAPTEIPLPSFAGACLNVSSIHSCRHCSAAVMCMIGRAACFHAVSFFKTMLRSQTMGLPRLLRPTRKLLRPTRLLRLLWLRSRLGLRLLWLRPRLGLRVGWPGRTSARLSTSRPGVMAWRGAALRPHLSRTGLARCAWSTTGRTRAPGNCAGDVAGRGPKGRAARTTTFCSVASPQYLHINLRH